MLLKITLIMFAVISYSYCLKSNEFCSNSECTIAENIECLKPPNCIGKYKYQCGSKYCSTSKINCDYLIKLIREKNYFGSIRFKIGIEKLFNERMDHVNKFISIIRKCPV